MAGILPRLVPPDTAAYGKGGSIDSFGGFHCLSVPGQMVLGGAVPVTFCFTVNWDGLPSTIPTVTDDFLGTIHDVLHETATAFG